MKTLFLILTLALSLAAQAPTRGYFTVDTVSAPAGSTITVPIRYDPDATVVDQVAFSFSLSYDTALLSNPRAVAGPDVPMSTTVGINPNTPGRIGVLIDSPNIFSKPNADVIDITFDVTSAYPSRRLGINTPIGFVCSPVGCGSSDPWGILEYNFYTDGYVTITR